MKKLFSTTYSSTAFNLALLVLRATFGLLILINFGLFKLSNFGQLQSKFANPFGLGSKWSLILVIFAEVFCSILVVLGLFTRFATIPLIIAMGVVIFIVAKDEPLIKLTPAILFFSGFISILLAGPGKISVDGLIGK